MELEEVRQQLVGSKRMSTADGERPKRGSPLSDYTTLDDDSELLVVYAAWSYLILT